MLVIVVVTDDVDMLDMQEGMIDMMVHQQIVDKMVQMD